MQSILNTVTPRNINNIHRSQTRDILAVPTAERPEQNYRKASYFETSDTKLYLGPFTLITRKYELMIQY